MRPSGSVLSGLKLIFAFFSPSAQVQRHPFLPMTLLLLLTLLTACGTKGDTQLNSIAERYVRAALALDRHDPGFVDAYYGPAAWREAAEEAGSLEDLQEEVATLRHQLAELDTLLPRVEFLGGQLQALDLRIRLVQGASIPFAEEVEGLFGFTPVRYPEERFESVHQRLDQLLPGGEPLAERMHRYDQRFLVPTARILSLFEEAAAECRRRTRDLVPLPEEEQVNLTLVSDKPWGAYNWYQGGAVSNIEINTDLPRRANTILHYVAHEAYPGHHTELTLRDRLLAGEEDWPEYFVYPLYSPQSHVSEGGADLGIELIFTAEEIAAFYDRTVLPAAGIEDVDVPQMLEIMRLRSELDHAAENAAFLLFEDGVEEREAVEYLERWALMTRDEAAKRIEFIQAYRGYVFNYRTGYELVKAYVTGGEASLQAQRQRFRHIWTTPVTPDMLLRWTASAPQDPS